MTLTGIIIEFITISVLFLVFPQLLKINKLGQLFVFGNSTTLGVKEMFNSRTVLNGSFEISSSTRHIVGLPTRFASKQYIFVYQYEKSTKRVLFILESRVHLYKIYCANILNQFLLWIIILLIIYHPCCCFRQGQTIKFANHFQIKFFKSYILKTNILKVKRANISQSFIYDIISKKKSKVNDIHHLFDPIIKGRRFFINQFNKRDDKKIRERNVAADNLNQIKIGREPDSSKKNPFQFSSLKVFTLYVLKSFLPNG